MNRRTFLCSLLATATASAALGYSLAPVWPTGARFDELVGVALADSIFVSATSEDSITVSVRDGTVERIEAAAVLLKESPYMTPKEAWRLVSVGTIL